MARADVKDFVIEQVAAKGVGSGQTVHLSILSLKKYVSINSLQVPML